MQPAKRDAPQCGPLQAAFDKGMRPNQPVPKGCCEKARLLRCTVWQGKALASAPRLASIAFSQQPRCEISVNRPWVRARRERYPSTFAGVPHEQIDSHPDCRLGRRLGHGCGCPQIQSHPGCGKIHGCAKDGSQSAPPFGGTSSQGGQARSPQTRRLSHARPVSSALTQSINL